MHYSARSHLLKLESVMDRQSKVIYSMRDRIVEIQTEEMVEEALHYLHSSIQQVIENYFLERVPAVLIEGLSPFFPELTWDLSELVDLEKPEVVKNVYAEYLPLESKILSLKEDDWLAQQLKGIFLYEIDTNWIKHLDRMAQIKDGIGLRGYAHEDPYRNFEFEAVEEFKYLLFTIHSGVAFRLIQLLNREYDVEESLGEEVE
jgi:preprotein translocase subunit SecA